MSRSITSCRVAAVATAALVAAVVTTAAVAAGRDPDNRLYVGMNLHFTGPTTTAGTFVASGAVADSGTASVDGLSIVPGPDGIDGRLSGRLTFTGAHGTIATRFEGDAFPVVAVHGVGVGRFDIVSGTGAYAGLTGCGSFQIVVDSSSNELIGTETGSVQP